MLRTRILFPVLFLALLAAACAPQMPPLRSGDYLNDDSLVTGDPCEAPCWNGITPGETTFEDAYTILEDDAGVAGLEQQSLEEEGQTAVLAFWQQAETETYCCQILAETAESPVSHVLLRLAPELIVDDVLEVYGEPDYVFPAALTDSEAVMQLVYMDVPMVVWAFVAGPEGSFLANSDVVAVVYTTAEAIQESVEGVALYAWDGYQPFTLYVEGTPVRTPEPTPEPTPED